MAASQTGWQDHLLLATCMIGIPCVLKLILQFLTWTWRGLFAPPKDLTAYGSWAVITGCTDGVGRAMTLDLGSRGLNLVLVGRSPRKLEDTSDEVRGKAGGDRVRIKTVVIDFSEVVGEEVEARMRGAIDGLDVGVLVNNVGLATPTPGVYPGAKFFHEVDVEGVEGLIGVNLRSATWVTRAVLPGMVKRKRGAIVNIGSGSCVAAPAWPLFTLYAATKAYLHKFSRTLSVEYQKYGIDVQCQVPGFIATKMTSMRRFPLVISSPEEYSKASVRWMGRGFVCTPNWNHALGFFAVSLLPDALVSWVIFRVFLGDRKETLRKEAMMKVESRPSAASAS